MEIGRWYLRRNQHLSANAFEFTCSGTTCECTTSGKEGTSCCDPDDCGTDDSNNCEEVCKVCD